MFFIVVVVTTCLAYIRKLLSSPGQPYGNRISTATRSNSSPPNCRAWWGVTTSCVPLPSCCFIHHWPSYLCWWWIFSQWFLAPSYLRWPISCLTFFFYFLSPFMYPLSVIILVISRNKTKIQIHMNGNSSLQNLNPFIKCRY